MSIQGGVEEMKSGRVVVTPEVEHMSDIWFYQDGLIKNKVMHAERVIICWQLLEFFKSSDHVKTGLV